MKLKGIDTSTTEGKIKVMEAHAKGRKIARYVRVFDGEWLETKCPTWDWGSFTYDVIEEPKELYLVEVRLKGTDKLYAEYYRTSLESAERVKAEALKIKAYDLYATITKFVAAE